MIAGVFLINIENKKREQKKVLSLP